METGQGLDLDPGWMEIRREKGRVRGREGKTSLMGWQVTWDVCQWVHMRASRAVTHALGPKETVSDLTDRFLCLVAGCADASPVCCHCRKQVSRLLSSNAGRSSAPGIESGGVWRSRS